MFYRSEKIVEGCGEYKKGTRFEFLVFTLIFQTSIEKSRGNEAGQIFEGIFLTPSFSRKISENSTLVYFAQLHFHEFF